MYYYCDHTYGTGEGDPSPMCNVDTAGVPWICDTSIFVANNFCVAGGAPAAFAPVVAPPGLVSLPAFTLPIAITTTLPSFTSVTPSIVSAENEAASAFTSILRSLFGTGM